jgi:hypothetical protein
MARVAVSVTEDGDGLDAETAQRPNDAYRDLPSIGDEHRFEHGVHIRKTP